MCIRDRDIDALIAYLSGGYKAPNVPYDPAHPSLKRPRIVQVP